MRIILLLWLLSSLEAKGQFWEQVASFPGSGRDDACRFSIGDLHFCGTGRGTNFACTGDFYVYNSLGAQWNSVAALPLWQERQYATGFSYQEAGYVLGGENCNGYYFKTFWRYAPLTDTWELMPEFPGTGRAGAQHFLLGSDLYWIGGRNDSGILNEVWCFHFDTQTWQQLGNLPFAGIWRGLSFSYNGSGYIACGRNNENNQIGWNNATWQYNPSNDQWTNCTNLLDFGSRMYVGSAQEDATLFVFGGVDTNEFVASSLEKFNLNSFQSESLLPFSGASRKGCISFVGNGFFHLSTGISGTERLNETWRIAFSPEAQINEIENFEVSTTLEEALLQVQIPGSWLGQLLLIKDLQGRTLASYQLTQTKQVISLLDFPSGSYLVCVNGFAQKCVR